MVLLDKSKRMKKELTLFNIYTIATGATIASGFFLLPGIAFGQAGPSMVISYVVAAIPVIPALFCMAELSTAMPRAGGVYFFLDRSMGPIMGTIGGLGTWMALILKTAFALVGIGAYTSLFFPQIQILPLAAGFAILFGIINLLGAEKIWYLSECFSDWTFVTVNLVLRNRIILFRTTKLLRISRCRIKINFFYCWSCLCKLYWTNKNCQCI